MMLSLEKMVLQHMLVSQQGISGALSSKFLTFYPSIVFMTAELH